MTIVDWFFVGYVLVLYLFAAWATRLTNRAHELHNSSETRELNRRYDEMIGSLVRRNGPAPVDREPVPTPAPPPRKRHSR